MADISDLPMYSMQLVHQQRDFFPRHEIALLSKLLAKPLLRPLNSVAPSTLKIIPKRNEISSLTREILFNIGIFSILLEFLLSS